MTTLIETVKKAQIQARKTKDEVSAGVLTTLIGEAEMIGKNAGNRASTDSEVTAVIKKFVKNIDETVTVLSRDAQGNSARLAVLAKEKEILAVFLPKQLNEVELKAEMQKLVAEFSIAGPKGMGVLMKELKARFDGQYDGGAASKIAKELLV